MPHSSPARSPLRTAVAALLVVVVARAAAGPVGAWSGPDPQRATAAPVTSVRTDVGRRAVPAAPVSSSDAVRGRSPSVSGDGRFVAYLAPATDGRDETVVLEDRELDLVTDLLPLPDDLVPGGSAWPVLSSDGCTVTVVTELALDRYRDGERGGRWDVYQLRLAHCGGGDWQLVSGGGGAGVTAEASNAVESRSAPAVSGDGTVVVYVEHRDDDGTTGLVVVDTARQIGTDLRRREVSAGTGVRMADPTLDGAGALLAATAVSGDATTSRVLVWDLSAGGGATPMTVPGSGRSWQPALSGDGAALAFVSDAADVVTGATMGVCRPECVAQVYLHRFDDGSTTLVSRAPGSTASEPVAGNGPSSQPALGVSGAEVVFISRANNFFSTRHRVTGGPGDGELVRAAVPSGMLWREHTLDDGLSPAPRVSANPAISANGRVVAADAASSSGGRVVEVTVARPLLELDELDVGTTELGFTTMTATMTVTNHGPSVFVPVLVAVDLLDFRIVGGSCTTPGSLVGPGSSCTVDVSFEPGAPGAQSATLRVAEEGLEAATATAPLRGGGGEPVLVAVPGRFDLQSHVVGERTWPVSVVFQNTSSSRVRVATVLLGGASDDFVVVADGCTGERLRGGDTCRVDVVFEPRSAGRRSATLRATAASGAYATVSLVGEAHYEPSVRFGRGAMVRPDDIAAVMVGTGLEVLGEGFAPSTPLVVLWADGSGRSVRVTTDADGRFSVPFVVLPGERLGRRRLVVLAEGHSASVRVRVVNPPPR